MPLQKINRGGFKNEMPTIKKSPNLIKRQAPSLHPGGGQYTGSFQQENISVPRRGFRRRNELAEKYGETVGPITKPTPQKRIAKPMPSIPRRRVESPKYNNEQMDFIMNKWRAPRMPIDNQQRVQPLPYQGGRRLKRI